MTEWKKGFGRVIALAMLWLPVACQTTDTGVEEETDYSCIIFLPIDWSDKDTVRTRERILEHNAVWEELCA